MFLNFKASNKALILNIFRSSDQFVTGNNNGFISLFNGSKMIKSIDLKGGAVAVSHFNSQVVAAVENGKVTIMNENLGIIKEFAGTDCLTRSICLNQTYIALCDYNYSVWYCKRNDDVEPKVILQYLPQYH